MQVRHGLAGIRAVVQHKPEAGLPKAKRAGHLCRLEQQMAEECLVIRPGLVNARDRFARDNQNMRRGSGRDVAKRHNLLVLIHNVGRDFLVADFLEQRFFGLVHYESSSTAPAFSVGQPARSQPLTNGSRSPSMTPCTSLACTLVRRSFTMRYGWKT